MKSQSLKNLSKKSDMTKIPNNIIASFFQPKPKIKIDHKQIYMSNNFYVPDTNNV